jgi:2-polyprenyl-3-methyl-5-hydroxy-6-metoxy-1,4-benzoquinol methylase
MEKLLPDALKDLWRSVEEKKLSEDQFGVEQERLIDRYRRLWTEALLVQGRRDLAESCIYELGLYTRCEDSGEIRRLCRLAVETLAEEWRNKVDPKDRKSVENFYNETRAEIYELMWWHTLVDDLSPLSYVTALQFAERKGCHSCLDFGAGAGSGSILFARHGFEVGLADISSPLLEFSRWRFGLRNLPGEFYDLKTRGLPPAAFDMITAMDVFEHLADPVEALETLSTALRPGGFLYGRFHAEHDEDRPLHVVHDFGPSLKRLGELGFIQVWQDEWLWGHQVFQKSARQ